MRLFFIVWLVTAGFFMVWVYDLNFMYLTVNHEWLAMLLFTTFIAGGITFVSRVVDALVRFIGRA